jgi:hypothetical protein
MNLHLRHSLAWRMIGPIPFTVIAAIVAVWFLVPRMIPNTRMTPEQSPLPVTMFLDVSAVLAKQDMTIALYSKFPFPNRDSRVLRALPTPGGRRASCPASRRTGGAIAQCAGAMSDSWT